MLLAGHSRVGDVRERVGCYCFKGGVRLRAPRVRSISLLAAVLVAVAFLACFPCRPLVADSATPKQYRFSGFPLAPTTFAYPVPLEDSHATAIACMKRLPDGAAVCVNRKTVIAISNGDLYIEEADRSAGIRIDTDQYYPPMQLEPGHLITFAGEMGTIDGERVIYARSEFDADLAVSARISSLGMASPAIMGWPIDPKNDPDGPRITGLMPIGLLVRVWGGIVARELSDEEGAWYVYLDDGWNKKDGTYPGYTGIRVYSDKIPLQGEDFQVAIGVCTTKTYDPTPFGPEGDEFVVPVVRTTDYQDLYYPATSPVAQDYGAISGSVRLIGQTQPGVDVRIYCGRDSVILENVTDSWVSYTLNLVRVEADKVTASAAGYVSDTLEAAGGDSGVDFELVSSQKHVEVGCDKLAIRTCSQETALVTAMVRDCEGKGLAGEQVRLTTTTGSFVDTGQPETIVTTDLTGFVSTLLTASPDGAGIASIVAEPYPVPQGPAQIELTLTGPEVAVTADTSYLAQPGSSAILAYLTDGSQPIVDAPVEFQTDHGLFQETGTDTYSANTDAQGVAQAVLVVDTPGVARVLARHINACDHGTVGWATVAYKSLAWHNDGAQHSHPLVTELDGNPDGKEVVVVTTSGNLSAIRSDGTVLWYKPMHQPGSNTPACSPVDAERSGLPCVFICAENQQRVYGFSPDGTTLAGWPAGTNYRFIKVAPSIGDINRDGTVEIVAGDESCYVFSWNPTGDWKATGTAQSSFLWRNLTGTPSTAIYGSTCALGDLDDDVDGILDVFVGTNHAPEVYGFPGDAWGDFIFDPLYVDGWPKGALGRAGSSPAIGDIDGDGKNDLAVGSDNGELFMWLSSDGSWTGHPAAGSVKSSPALCDLDGDGKLDVIVGSDSGRVFTFNFLGQALPGS